MASTTVAPTRWNHATEEFLIFMRDERSASGNTISAYHNDLTQLGEYFAMQGKSNLADITAQDLQTFVSHLKDDGVSNATLARRVSCIRTFFDFTENLGLTPTNPAEDLTGPIVVHKEVEALSDDQAEALLAACRSKRFMPKRDSAMIRLAVRLGLNSSEIVGLRLDDFDEIDGTLVVTHRGKSRVITLPEDCTQDILSYVGFERYSIQGSRRSPFIFLGQKGEVMCRQALWIIIRDCANKVGITTCSPRLLRNTAAKRMLRDGVPEDRIRQTLGLSESNKLKHFR